VVALYDTFVSWSQNFAAAFPLKFIEECWQQTCILALLGHWSDKKTLCVLADAPSVYTGIYAGSCAVLIFQASEEIAMQCNLLFAVRPETQTE
jgi:hypothetical protein